MFKKKNLYLILLVILTSLSNLNAQTKAPKPVFSDGPYLFYQDQSVVAKWMENNQLQQRTFSIGENLDLPEKLSPDFDLHFEDLENRPVRQEEINFTTNGPIVALSDVHGQYLVTLKLLRENRIIDENNNWIFGNGHLVLVGDIFDRGDQVTELLWFFHKLERQAPKSGGQVHVLLGNHELMVLTGDLRYLHKKYRYTMAVMQMPLNELFSKNSYLGAWLRSRPLAITINDMAFVHGGFSELLLEKTNSLATINRLGQKSIDAAAEESASDSLLTFMGTINGPLWYRGYFDKEQVSKQNANTILKKLGKKHIIVGHTSHEAIVSLFGNKIIGVDSSIKFGKRGEILIVDRGEFYRGTVQGERIKL